ncbi:hypothetical protein B0H10DRAFT_2027646 [Mycena sp. CBHHK59/15]|nr:hypothetical protein B0H10DRAFT_2027646 [Mycena sp. CBHHK59/15]
MCAGAGAVVVEHSSSAVSISSSAKLKSEATRGADGTSIIEVPAVGASVRVMGRRARAERERGEVRRCRGEGEEAGVGVHIGMCTGIDVGGEADAVTAACGGGESPSRCPTRFLQDSQGIRMRALRGTATTDRTPTRAPCRRPWRRRPRRASVAHDRPVNASHGEWSCSWWCAPAPGESRGVSSAELRESGEKLVSKLLNTFGLFSDTYPLLPSVGRPEFGPNTAWKSSSRTTASGFKSGQSTD